MSKRILLITVLVAAMALLAGCGDKQAAVTTAPAALPTQQPAMQATNVPVPEFDASLPEDYDPSLEEDPGSLLTNEQPAQMAVHAGATPIPIDPVDMPTPTPRQALAFTYSKYTANKLGISFESIAGYEIDESQADSYTLREPDIMVKDNYAVEISFQITPTGSNYKIDNLRSELSTKLKDLGAINYTEWSVTTLSKRTLLGKEGYYGNYRGVMYDGTIVRGRVHMALLDGKLLTFHISNPGWYNTDYINVYTHIRDTIKLL